MAGYLFAADQWGQFERKARKFFKAQKVSVFHAKKFDKCTPQSNFAGWGVAKQAAFVDAWFEIAKNHALRGITVSLPKERYDEVRKEKRKNLNISSFGQCFSGVLQECVEDEQVLALMQREGLSVIVESGNQNNEGLVQIFNRVRKDGLDNLLKSIGFCDKDDCNAIQLADFLAFYSCRYTSECHNKHDDGTASCHRSCV